jgi:phosphoribosylformylglycinamidine synthase subunit PurL
VLEEMKKPRDYTADLKKLLASSNICSKRWVYEQYDTMVQTNTVQGPGGEAGVMRIKGTGTPGHERGLAMALAGNSRWCYLDPKLGAMHAVAEAARKVACTGATPVAATNCLNFGNPEKPEIMAQLSAAIDGIAEACTALGTPITGGNVSLYNETKGEGIYPTPVIGVVGILDDVANAVPAGFQREGDAVLLLRPSFDGFEHHRIESFGSSECVRVNLNGLWGRVPTLDLRDEFYLQKALIKLAEKGLIHSACDISDGGLATRLAEASFSHNIGVATDIEGKEFPISVLAYFEEPASFVAVTCDPANQAAVKTIVEDEGELYCQYLGETIAGKIDLRIDGKSFISASIANLKQPWSQSLESTLHDSTANEVLA